MVTVSQAHGLAVRIYKDDHPPAHVHVVGNGIAKINLQGLDSSPSIVFTRGMNRAEVRRAWQLVVQNRAFLLEQGWSIHGA